MRVRSIFAAAALFGGALMAAAGALAQDWGDTPYVQTPMNVVEAMLKIAKVGASDYVIDLGSGDGRMVITAAKKYGARGFGVDLDAKLVALANRNAAKAGVAGRAAFYQRDLHVTDVSRATVMSIYLLPEVNLMIRDRLLATLRPGTRIVSHDYGMGDWPPDYQTELAAPGKTVGVGQRSKILYWMVPGNVAGRWHWRLDLGGKPVEFRLALQQNFQFAEGAIESGAGSARVTQARLEGEHFKFTVLLDGARYTYSGRLLSHALEGTVRIERGGKAVEQSWKATRVELWEPRHVTAQASRSVKEHQ